MLDTNVLVSALLYGGIPGRIFLFLLQGRFRHITSPALLAELERVLAETFQLPKSLIDMARAGVERVSEVHQPAQVPNVLKDLPDNQVLAAATEGGASAIVTGDTELLDLGQHRGIRIVTPRQFLDELGLEET